LATTASEAARIAFPQKKQAVTHKAVPETDYCMKSLLYHFQAQRTPGSAEWDCRQDEGRENDATRFTRAFDSGRTFSGCPCISSTAVEIMPQRMPGAKKLLLH